MGDPSAARGTQDPATANRFGPPPASAGAGPTVAGTSDSRRDAAKDQALRSAKQRSALERFRTLVNRAFAGRVRQMGVFKAEYDEAMSIVVSTKDSETLAALMTAYLDLYAAHASNPDAIGYYRSDQLFLHTFEQCGRVSDVALFERWDHALSGRSLDEEDARLRQRFATLLPTFRSQLEVFRQQQRDKMRKSGSLLDLLKAEYTRLNQRPPKDFTDLYTFDPRPNRQMRAGLDGQIELARQRWDALRDVYSADARKRLDLTLQGFATYVRMVAQQDLMNAFQTVRWLQLMLITSATGQEPIEQGILLEALYGIACSELLTLVMQQRAFARNLKGFTPEEVDYFSRPLGGKGSRYASNVRAVLTPPFPGPGAAVGEMQVLLGATALTHNRLPGLDLLHRDKTMEIQKKWVAAKDVTEEILAASRSLDYARLSRIFADPRNDLGISMLKDVSSTEIVVDNPQVLGQGTVAAGSTLGTHRQFGDFTIVYIEPTNTNEVYIELGELRPMLFRADRSYIKARFYTAMIDEVYRGTVGMLAVTQGVFLAIGFLPVLIESGFAGLIYEILVTLVADEVGDAASKVNPIFGQVVSNLIQIFTPRKQFGPKLKGLAELEAEQRGLTGGTLESGAALADRATGTGTAVQSDVDQAINRLQLMDEYQQQWSGLSLRPKDLNETMRARSFPVEWNVKIQESRELRQLIRKVENPRLVRIGPKQRELLPFQFQRSSMGSEYELHFKWRGEDYRLDGIVRHGNEGKFYIGESKFTYKDAFGQEPMESLLIEDGRSPMTSWHYNRLDDKVLPQLERYSKLAREFGFEGVAVYANTDFLWATFLQTTDHLKNVHAMFHEYAVAKLRGLEAKVGRRATGRKRN